MEHRQPSRSYSLQYILIEIFDIISFFVFIVWLMLCIRFFLFNPFTVVGKSMEPTFRENDFIIIDKITPQHDALATVAHTVLPDSWASHVEKSLPWLHRGDVVVFIPPGKDVPFIKRIIWLPWEVVKVDDNKVLICNSSGADCNQLNEPYIPSTFQTVASCGKDTFEVQWWYFVMGDHRWHTTDSLCCFGLICTAESNYVVPENYIIGRVLYRVFPESKRF